MELTFALFATLPLALFSFLSRGKRADAGFGFLAALAPVLTSAVGGLFNRKSKQSAQDKEIEYKRQQAEQEEANRRAAFEAQQNSPQAQMQRLGFNTRLASLLGGFGGREQTPGFILNAFDAARSPQEYTPGAEFIAPPKQGGSFWDYAGDAANAASYYDTSGRQRSKAAQSGAGAAPGAAPTVAPQAGGLALPSSFKNKDYFSLNKTETPAADEFMRKPRGY